MQIARNAASRIYGKLNQMTDVESQLKEAKRVYDLNKYPIRSESHWPAGIPPVGK